MTHKIQLYCRTVAQCISKYSESQANKNDGLSPKPSWLRQCYLLNHQ